MSVPVPESGQTVPIAPAIGSLRRRYLYKLVANLAGMIMNFFIQALIPRGLGPKSYGDYCFITNSFSQLTGFLDMGTSTAFYTKLSQRTRETSLVTFYIGYGAVLAVILFVFVAVSAMTPVAEMIWPNQYIPYLFLGATWGILTWMVQVVGQMTDAYGVTIRAEVAKTVQKAVALGLILLIYTLNRLDISNLFYYQFIVALLLIGHLVYIMRQETCLIAIGRIDKIRIKAYIIEFYRFAHPLMALTLSVLLTGLFDRWIIQIFSGSVQQGFYGLSYQIGSICFIFSSAMIPLLAREFSMAFGARDVPQMAILFRRYVPVLCALSAFFSCFAMIQSHNIVLMYSGREFSGATAAVQIMAIFAIYQTYGQLTSSVLYATGLTTLYRNIGIVAACAGIPLTWLLVAPLSRLGFGLGATGLALKVLTTTIFAVNIQLYYTTRMLGLSFSRFLGHQIISMSVFSGMAWLTSSAVSLVVSGPNQHYYQFLLSGFIYSLGVITLIYLLPSLIGLKKTDIIDILGRLKALSS